MSTTQTGIALLVFFTMACGASESPETPSNQNPDKEEIGITAHRISYNGNDYLFVDASHPYQTAKTLCGQYGYNLVTINDANEQIFINNQVVRNWELAGRAWWIGYNDIGIEGVWTWESGYSTYSNWMSGEPNNFNGNEDCALMYSSTGQWNDGQCSDNISFICERIGAPPSRGQFSYVATNTNSATQNTADYNIYLSAGQVFTVGTCGVAGASGTGDTYLRVFRGGQQVASNDGWGGNCGGLSNLSFVVQIAGTYTIRAGCYLSSSCGGAVAWTY